MKRGFQEHKDDPEFQSKSKDEKLGFLFGICEERSEDFITPLERVSDFIEGFAKDFVEDLTQTQAWEKGKKLFPNKNLHITKAGRIFIEFRRGGGAGLQSPILATTEKAIKVGAQWIPKSQSFIKKSGSQEVVFVSEWFFPKLQEKITSKEKEIDLRFLEKALESIKKTKERLKDPNISEVRKKKLEQFLEEDKIEVKELRKELGLGKGRGWHGESERHSTAAKKGKKGLDFIANLIEDITFKEAGLRKATPEEIAAHTEKKVPTWKKKVDKIVKGLEREAKDYPLDRLMLERFARALKDTKVKKNAKSLMDVLWKFFKKVEDRYGELRGVGADVKYFVKPWLDPENLKRMQKELEPTFKSLGLKKKGSGKGKGWFGDPEGHSKAAKKGKHDFDFITFKQTIEDVFGKKRKAARTEEARRAKQLKKLKAKSAASKRTKVAQQLKSQLGITPQTSVVSSGAVTVPAVPNIISPTGAQTSGTLAPNFNRPLQPVTSSNVKGAGVFNEELVVQFHDSQGTYRYQFDNNQEANEAYLSLISDSPGGYVWDKLRGKKKGPAFFSGKPTPGGTTASIVPYDVSGRTPINKTPNFEKIAKQLRTVKTLIKKPPTSRDPFTFQELASAQPKLARLGL